MTPVRNAAFSRHHSITMNNSGYQSITSYFTEDFVSYEDTIKNMRKIIQDVSF